jgi:hypothetical protein
VLLVVGLAVGVTVSLAVGLAVGVAVSVAVRLAVGDSVMLVLAAIGEEVGAGEGIPVRTDVALSVLVAVGEGVGAREGTPESMRVLSVLVADGEGVDASELGGVVAVVGAVELADAVAIVGAGVAAGCDWMIVGAGDTRFGAAVPPPLSIPTGKEGTAVTLSIWRI